MTTPFQPSLDRPTLQHVIERLEARLQAVVTYGSGGCPTCHDAELRGAIATLRRLAEPAPAAAPSELVTAGAKHRRK